MIYILLICDVGGDMSKKEKFFYNEKEDEIIVSEILKDFEQRRNERRPFELAWQLNMNFVLGNQYCQINGQNEIGDQDKMFSWECREVYNHIAPIVETRLAKLAKVRPGALVRPSSSEDRDVACAKLSKAVLDYSASRHDLSSLISEATAWSEVTGTAFYKVAWLVNGGDLIAETDEGKFYEGDIDISVCSPFEIFPDSCGAKDVSDCTSIIHARAVPAKEVEEKYGVTISGEDIDIFTLDNNNYLNGYSGRGSVKKVTKLIKHDHCLLIEKYTKPSLDQPNGRLTIIAQGKLLYDGELPYINGYSGKRDFPFVKQIACFQINSFWGSSVVERCIPIQRAYNAIKNRKHEFLARLSAGVLAVEDGSVDVDNLEDEGLAPGKILIYRSGSAVPKFMDAGDVPFDFNREEDRLLNEFDTVSGVSELMRESRVPGSLSSGTALSLLIEQDETRLSSTAENIRTAVKKIAGQILRLYKQFATTKRLCHIADENGQVEIYYWTGSDLCDSEIVLDTVNELTETPAQRRNTMLELFRLGLFHDENGKLSNRIRFKLLEGLGFGMWDYAHDERLMQTRKANEENLRMKEGLMPNEFDDHVVHMEEHKKFLFSKECDNLGEEYKRCLIEHIKAHKKMGVPDKLLAALANDYDKQNMQK